ncbi:MAG: response regulator [Planctomycetes bacterium]|nr:response regulator [Planctomycetota bacterium]
MDKSKIMQRLMATFLEELEEYVRSFNQDLLALEKNPPPEEQAQRFKTLFRTAHSLKGAARAVNVDPIEAACHSLEEILVSVRDGERFLGQEVFALLFAAVDAFEEAGMRLREQQDLADAPLAALLPRLEAACRGAALPAVEKAPSAPKQPVPAQHDAQARVEAPVAASLPTGAENIWDGGAGSTSVRVAAEKLDSLLARVGELQVAQRRIEARATDLLGLQDLVAQWKSDWKRVDHFFGKAPRAADSAADRGTPALTKRVAKTLRQAGENLRLLDKALERLALTMTSDSRLLDQVTRPLDDDVRRIRMLPFADACAGLDRMIRDLAQTMNKDVEFNIEGGAVELDRSILEGLKDPLRHLVRNALDHGIELPAERLRARKPARATIRISAALRGSQVEITVADDGRGIDLGNVRAQARRHKIEEPADDRELARLIFQPGFSTASIITDVSGRGVGLDVVKNAAESLHGTVDLSFTVGLGTRFILTVPLTLTTLRAVLVRAGGRTCAFAGANVQRMVKARVSDIRTVSGREILTCDGVPLPLAVLGSILDPRFVLEATHDGLSIVIVASGARRVAFIVDEVLTEQEILIKNLGTRIRRVPLVAGATLLPSGQIALVLNAANLMRTVLREGGVPTARRPIQAATPVAVRKRLLIVEDSMTTRTLMKSILEAAGFEIATAVDGQAAWHDLQHAQFDLVVSDVDMPNMDGFDLTAAIRASQPHAEMPVILVTARESEADKARGIEVGANAYLVKSGFDQRNLLETIHQML